MAKLVKILGYTTKLVNNNLVAVPYQTNTDASQYEQIVLEVSNEIAGVSSIKALFEVPDGKIVSAYLEPQIDRNNVYRIRLNELLGNEMKVNESTNVSIRFVAYSDETSYTATSIVTYKLYKTNTDSSYIPTDIDVLFINQNKIALMVSDHDNRIVALENTAENHEQRISTVEGYTIGISETINSKADRNNPEQEITSRNVITNTLILNGLDLETKLSQMENYHGIIDNSKNDKSVFESLYLVYDNGTLKLMYKKDAEDAGTQLGTTINFPIDNFIKSGRYDGTTESLILVLQDDTEITIPVTALIDAYSGEDTSTIQMIVDKNSNTIKANIKHGSITKDYMDAEIKSAVIATVNVVASEATRNSNEAQRILDENIRKNNEITRQANENTRISNETSRETRFAEAEAVRDGKVDAKIAELEQYRLFKVVNELPTTDITENTIYLVPNAETEGDNKHEEYAYVNGNWEHIGNLSIDLSNYPTNTDLDTKLLDYATTSMLEDYQTIDDALSFEETTPDTVQTSDTLPSTEALIRNSILNMVYPVGSIYMSVNSTSPQTFLGGTWVRLENRFLMGAGSSYGAGTTGGSATHTLTIDEIPSHNHFASTQKNVLGLRSSGGTNIAGGSFLNNVDFWNSEETSTGGNQPHSILNPYLAVYMYKRVA